MILNKSLRTLKDTLDSDATDPFHKVIDQSLLLMEKGDVLQAEAALRQSIEASTDVVSKGSCDVLNELAILLLDKREMDEAGLFCRQALAGYEKVLGPEHLLTFRALANLGNVLREEGSYKEAEPLVRRALEGFEKMHDSCYYLPWALHLLGTLLTEKGDLGEAEAVMRRALEEYQGNRFEGDVRPEDRETLECTMHLAQLLRQKVADLSDEDDEIETLYRQALTGFETLLGAEHPDTLMCMDELVTVLFNKGQYDGCEVLLRRLLERQEKVLGLEQPATLRSLHNLGCLLIDTDDKASAEALFRRALTGEQKNLSAEDPTTLRTVHMLSILLCKKGDNDEAAALYRHGLENLEKALESDHRETIKIVDDYCALLTQQGDSNSAIDLFQRTLTWVKNVLGPDHFISPILRDKIASLTGKT